MRAEAGEDDPAEAVEDVHSQLYRRRHRDRHVVDESGCCSS